MTPQHDDRPRSHLATELASQPETWRRAGELAASATDVIPRGARVAAIGCGTSWFMAQAYAARREALGHGETDAFAASDAPLGRAYDVVVAITRSGTTTEVLDAVAAVRGRIRTVGIVGDTSSPFPALVDDLVALPFADEQSVVQTRFATSALAYLRATLGESLEPAARDAEAVLAEPLDPVLVGAEQITYLGSGWTVGLAHEAALKSREAAQSWTESYPAMDYRHGPVSIAAPGRVTWLLGTEPEGLAAQVRATGAHWEWRDRDALAELVRAQRVALARAERAGVDPDAPRGLTRSVILGS
jgi:fructoselysine-6-P-deglycase FrlB-like protein